MTQIIMFQIPTIVEPLNQLLYVRIAYPTNDLCSVYTLAVRPCISHLSGTMRNIFDYWAVSLYAFLNKSVFNSVFSLMFIVERRKYAVHAAVTIKMTNFDAINIWKKDTETCYWFLYVVLCAICQKRQVLISLLKNLHGVRFKNMYVYSKSLNQPKYWYLKNLLTYWLLYIFQ